MVYYKGWEDEYKGIFSSIQEMFSPEEVALISIGTLTFIKPVIKQLRRQKIRSKILQMPLEDAGGKLSYPMDIKVRMCKTCMTVFLSLWERNGGCSFICGNGKTDFPLWARRVFGITRVPRVPIGWSF